MWNKARRQKPAKPRSLMAKIFRVYLLLGAAAYLMAIAGTWWATYLFMETDLEEHVVQMIPQLDEVGAPLFFSDTADTRERIHRYVKGVPDILFIRYYAAREMKQLWQYRKTESVKTPPALSHGEVRVLHEPDRSEPLILSTQFLGVMNSLRVIAPVRTRFSQADDLLDISLADKPRDQAKTIGYIEIGVDIEPDWSIMAKGVALVSILIGLILAFALVLGRRSLRNAFKPLLNLQEPLVRLAKGDFDIEVDDAAGDAEITAISDALRSTIAGLRLRDIEKEQALRDKLNAELANQTKSQFLAHMSHEIRTPLNGVLGFLALLGKTELNEIQRNYLRTTEISAKTLLAIINDILDFSKIEAGKLSIEVINLDLRELIEECVSLHGPSAHGKGLELALLYHRDVPTLLAGDPGRITQVVSNLLGNAIKFTEAGEIVVEVTLAGEAESSALVQISVTDTGIGISRDALDNLFQPFNQADASITRKYGGTGLGLAISSRLVEMMGGTIQAESTPGVGSRFFFTMHLKKQESYPAQKKPESVLAHLRVLSVSPNDWILSSLRENLLSWHVEEQAEESAKTALAALADATGNGSPYDVVIFDNAVNDMTADDFATRIKTESSLNKPPLVLLLNATERVSAGGTEHAGFSALLAKPVKSSELYNTLCRTLAFPRHATNATEAEKPGVAWRVESGKQLHILVVDDNEINRKLATILLEQFGADSDQAENGVAAIAACAGKYYDLILMDVHMPVMGGVEAAARIRELQGSGSRTPIIALTANALAGDQERYIAAGMDGYLSKPLDEKALVETIVKWCAAKVGISSRRAPIAEAAGQSAKLPAIDAKLGVERAYGKTDVWREVLGMLVKDLPATMDSIEAAYSSYDVKELGQLAHKLHGSSSYCGVPALQRAAKNLEVACAQNEAEKIGPAVEDLKRKAERLLDLVKSGNIPEM